MANAFRLSTVPIELSHWRLEFDPEISKMSPERLAELAVQTLVDHVPIVTNKTENHVTVMITKRDEAMKALAALWDVVHPRIFGIVLNVGIVGGGQCFEIFLDATQSRGLSVLLLLEDLFIRRIAKPQEKDWVDAFILKTHLAYYESWASKDGKLFLTTLRNRYLHMPFGPACTSCERDFPTITLVVQHVDAGHVDIPPSPWRAARCPACDFCASTPDSLAAHVRSAHPPPERMDDRFPYACPLCSYKCAFADGIEQHRKLAHAGQPWKKRPAYACPFCSFDCAHADGLQQHMDSMHAGQPVTKRPSYKCPLCSFEDSFSQVLQLHMYTAHPGTSLKAPIPHVWQLPADDDNSDPAFQRALALSLAEYESRPRMAPLPDDALNRLWQALWPGRDPPSKTGNKDCPICGTIFDADYAGAMQALPCMHAAYCSVCYAEQTSRGGRYATNCPRCGENVDAVRFRPYLPPGHCIVCRRSLDQLGDSAWMNETCGCLLTCSAACKARIPAAETCPLCLTGGAPVYVPLVPDERGHEEKQHYDAGEDSVWGDLAEDEEDAMDVS